MPSPVNALLLKQLERQVKDTPSVFFTIFSGLKAHQLNQLRRQFDGTQTRFRVVKNSLLRKAAGRHIPETLLNFTAGTVGVAFSADSPEIPSKTLVKFAKENENFAVAGGIAAGTIYSIADIHELAVIPSRDVLLARVLGGMNAPVSGLVGTLGQMIRGCVNALDALRKKKEAQESDGGKEHV